MGRPVPSRGRSRSLTGAANSTRSAASATFFKKSLGHCCPGKSGRFALMRHLHQQQPDMDVAETARALDLSRSGYDAHARKPLGRRRSEDAALGREIECAFTAARRTDGSPRILHALRAAGLRHGKKRIARLLRERGLRVRQKRRLAPRTTVACKDTPRSLPTFSWSARPQCASTRGLAHRHHLHPHRGRLARSRGREGCLQPPHHRLEHPRHSPHRAAARCAGPRP